MPKVAVFNMDGKQVGDIQLNEAVFGVEVNEGLMHQVVINQLANRRQGTHAVKNRAAVSGGGRKPWRQKGTGRARHGSTRSPIWVGGGTVFGPTPRDYSYSVPKKARRAALRSALSAKVQAGKLIVVDELAVAEPKTRVMANVFRALQAEKKPFVVLGQWDSNIEKSTRNIPQAGIGKSLGLNVYDVLNHEHLVMTKEAVAVLEEVLA